MKWMRRKKTTPVCAHCGKTWPKVRTVKEGQVAAIDHVLICKKNPFNIVIAEQVRRLKQSNIILKNIARNHPEILVEGSARHDQIKKNEEAIDLSPKQVI